jgi:hypothetical protein
VNIGSSQLRSIQLSVTYDASRLQVVSAVQGSQWPGGPFQANTDTSGTLTFGGACDAVTGLKELAVVRFNVLLSGTALIGGNVITMADASGTAIPSNSVSGRSFVAGRVSVILTGSRRRSHGYDSEVESLSGGDAAVVRRSGETSCANKPCSVCVNGRQTGDTDGDCLFDVRDVSYMRDYLNILASNPSDSRLNVYSAQLLNLDADKNGVINAQDMISY